MSKSYRTPLGTLLALFALSQGCCQPAGAADAIPRRQPCYLPAYDDLGVPAVRAELGISEGQERKLRALSDRAPRDLKTINFNVATLAQGGADAEVIGRQYLESLNKLRTDCRKAVEAALTPEQLEQLKKLALVDMADRALHDYPEIATARSFEPGTGGGTSDDPYGGWPAAPTQRARHG